MALTKSLLTKLGVTKSRADKYFPKLQMTFAKHKINNPLRIAHFLAQVLHESASLRVVQENLNYSAAGLLNIFGKYFKTQAEADQYARQPQKIANKVYANRIGNGNETSGDGYRFRGRGLIQLTGKSNYQKFSKWMKENVVTQPDHVAAKYAVHSAVYFWTSHKLNNVADSDDVKRVTKIINGGFNGLTHREEILHKAKGLLGIEESMVSEELTNPTHMVTASSLNFRSHPKDFPNTLIGSLPKGEKVKKLTGTTAPGWMKVQVILRGKRTNGYVSSLFLKALPRPLKPPTQKQSVLANPTHTVTATTLNFRSQPQASTVTLIGSIKKGQKIKKLNSAAPAGWFQIQVVLNGKLRKGYVSSKFVKLLPPPPQPKPAVLKKPTHTVSTSSLRLRSKPRVSSSTSIASLPKGFKVQKIGTSSVRGWDKVLVVLKGVKTKGYLWNRFLKRIPK
jgi:predicted chitinase